MDTTTEHTASAEVGFICDDDEDELDDIAPYALPFNTTDPTGPHFSTMSSPHQLGSTHDPFSQFPVRWEEAFGPLVQFCKSSLLVQLTCRLKVRAHN